MSYKLEGIISKSSTITMVDGAYYPLDKPLIVGGTPLGGHLPQEIKEGPFQKEPTKQPRQQPQKHGTNQGYQPTVLQTNWRTVAVHPWTAAFKGRCQDFLPVLYGAFEKEGSGWDKDMPNNKCVLYIWLINC